jgi:uncharacterized cupredoxin-like copper-binding protein
LRPPPKAGHTIAGMAPQWQRMLTAAVLATVGLGLGACGGGDDDKSRAGGEAKDPPLPGSTIEVMAKEFSFTPAKLTAKAGQPTTIAVKNTGSIDHDLTIGDAGFKLSVNSGKTGQKELKVDKPGTYEFHCSVAGHKDAGMKGELTVE